MSNRKPRLLSEANHRLLVVTIDFHGRKQTPGVLLSVGQPGSDTYPDYEILYMPSVFDGQAASHSVNSK